MSELEKNLISFRRRVRLMRAWRGLAVGGTLGALVSLVLSALDFFRLYYSSWLWLALPVAVGLFIGALVGFFRKVQLESLADSIDRRASLENRLGTAAENAQDDMRELQRGDALAHLKGLKPAAVFPVRMSRWHYGVLLASVIAASLFLLGNMPYFMSDKEKADKEALKEVAKSIERVAKPLLDRKPEEMTPETKKLAEKFDELKKELERGRIPKEEALQKANKLAEEAEKTAKENFQQSDQQMATAQQSLEKMATEDALKDSGLNKDDFKPGELEAASKMTPEQQQALSKDISDKMESLRSQMGSEGQKSGKQDPMDPQSMKDMEKELSDLQSQMDKGVDSKGNKLSKEQLEEMKKLADQLKELMKDLKISQKILDFMKKLQSMPEYKEIQELLRKLAKANQQGQSGDMKNPQLTEQELKELKEKLKQALKDMEDAISKMTDADIKKMMEDYKKALEDALDKGCAG